MSSSGMLLLLSALLLHSARAHGEGEGKERCQEGNCESCSGECTDVKMQICANYSVEAFLRDLHDFVCQNKSVNFSCVCVTPDLELPSVQRLPSQDTTESAVVSCVNVSVTVSAKDCGNTAEGDELKDLLKKVWMILKQPQVIAAFLTGLLLSAFVCFVGGKCHRKKPRGSGNKADGVATSQVVPLTDGQLAGNGESGEPREVEYSNIDFSRWNRNSPTVGEHAREATETEYAELQKDGNRQEPEENSGDSEEDVAVAVDEEETEQ